MRNERNSVWDRWDRDKLCSIDDNINTDMYISKLRVSKNNDTTIFNINDRDRGDIDRSIYSDGYIGILYTI